MATDSLNTSSKDTVTKPKNAHKCIKATYVIHNVYLLHVSASLAVILGEVRYKVSIHRHIIKLCELMPMCKILSFNNTCFKIHITTENTQKL